MNTLDLTRGDLIRALRPAIDRTVARRAESVARRFAAVDGVTAEVSPAQAGACTVTVSGPGLFAREFGSVDHEAKPVIAPALAAERENAP